MKKIVSSVILFVISFSILYGQDIKKKEYNIKNYNKLEVSNSLDVKLIMGDKEGVSLKCDERLIPGIKIEKSGSTLEIGLDRDKLREITGSSFFNRGLSIRKNNGKITINGETFKGGIEIIAYAKNLNELSVSSSGDVYVSGDFSTQRLQLSCSSSGDIIWKDHLSASNLSIKTSSSGDMSFDGDVKADNIEILCSSSGDIKANLFGSNAYVKISSSGDFSGNMYLQESLRASLSSAGGYEGSINAKTANFDLSSSSDVKVSGNIDDLNVSASSAADFYGRKIVYKNATVKTSSAANIYLSKSGKVVDNTARSTGVHVE